MGKVLRFYTTLLFLLMVHIAHAQITGVVTDAETGDTIYFPSAIYKGHGIAVSGDAHGKYRIARHNGWQLTISAMGYKSKTITVKESTPKIVNVKLRQDSKQLKEVVVKSKRKKYNRKENPAVELMKRVIAAKKESDLSNKDFYQYEKYQKIMLGMNDIQPGDIDSGFFSKHPVLVKQIERSPMNNKFVLPISVDETVTRQVYRKEPKTQKNIIMGQQLTGLNRFFQTGDILTIGLKDIFCDVNIYDDQIRLLQYRFVSPIGKSAVSFYRYYIEDTVYVDKDLCYHLQYIPNNQQDFGFRGELFIVADSTLHVKRCEITIPKKSDVNFVENLRITQEFTRLPEGDWVLTTDDMVVEMSIVDFLSKAIVVRQTRLSDYNFQSIPDEVFRGKGPERYERNAKQRGDDFWQQHRSTPLTKSEGSMKEFMKDLKKVKGFGYLILASKLLIENYIETGSETTPSKVDIGPVNTFLSTNYIDGLRTRFSAMTTANFSPHFFMQGYFARGWKSKKNYYRGELTWSFNHKEYMPKEYPKRTLSLSSSYDIMSPTDKFLPTDKDNVFTVLKWTDVNKMMFYNRQTLSFEWEEKNGLRLQASLKAEKNEATGSLFFTPLTQSNAMSELPPHTDFSRLLHNGVIRTTELHAEVEYSPGRTYVNSKQRRHEVNGDAPALILGHTLGVNGLLGGQYTYNVTEASIYKRFWMGSWGNIDCFLKGGAQWNKVPFPLLIIPESNLSYIVEDQMFNLVNNMEFLNDRYASLDVSWDMNGKIFNRIPLLHQLQWREWFGVKCLWGSLTDKNNPLLPQNSADGRLMYFPEGSYIMDHNKPYVELIAGVHNIFKLFHVEYVRRVSYNSLPTAHKNGIRVKMHITF